MRRAFGFTLVECVIALFILNGVVITIAWAVTSADKARANSEISLKADFLLEGLAAQARNAKAETFAGLETDVFYDLSVITPRPFDYADFLFFVGFRDLENARAYFFTNVPDTAFFAAAGGDAAFYPAPDFSPEGDYDFIINQTGTPVVIDETRTESASFLILPPDGADITVNNKSNAFVFIDIEGDNKINYTGGGECVITKTARSAPPFLICARVYTREMRLLNEIILYK